MTNNNGWLPPDGTTLTPAQAEELAVYAANHPGSTLTIIATGLERDGLPLVLIPGDGVFTVREVA